jgi:acetate kinase
VRCDDKDRSASDGQIVIEVIVEGIGHDAKLSVYEGKKLGKAQPIAGSTFDEACGSILRWIDEHSKKGGAHWDLSKIGCVGVRVVHGGKRFVEPEAITTEVEREISELGKWAPMHNPRSVEILAPLRERFGGIPLIAVFDTSFHATIPEFANLYGIPLELSRKYDIRRYGFHGISHRYLLERFAVLTDRKPEEVRLVTMHLESGCSVTAIADGRSVDNTMGLTPLEGLMMGTRCGDIDPSIIPYLCKEEGLAVDDVMNLLEKKSGLLMPEYDCDDRVRVAIDMFCYRVLKAVGSYLAVLHGADAVIFGGGIGENNVLLRRRVCDGLRWCGLVMDERQNVRLIDIEGRLSTEDSPIQAYVIPTEETLQIAHECCLKMALIQN